MEKRGTSTSASTRSSTSTQSSRKRARSEEKTVDWGSTGSIVCLCFGRGNSSKTVGLAALQPNGNRMFLAQFIDHGSFFSTCTMLNNIDARSIGISKTMVKRKVEPPLLKSLKNCLPDAKLFAIDRKHFNDNEGLETVRRLCRFRRQLPVLETDLKFQYYALASANALMSFVESTYEAVVPAAQSLKILILPPSDEVCQIDAFTIRELELIHSMGFEERNMRDTSARTLFDVVNYTCTTPGRQALKMRLIQPFRHAADIEEQLNNVDELVNNPDVLEDIRNLLKKSTDLEKIDAGLHTEVTRTCNKTSAVVHRIQNLLALKLNLGLIESLETVLQAPAADECVYLKSIHRFLHDNRLTEMSAAVDSYLIPEATLNCAPLKSVNMRVQCLRKGISRNLDEHRRVYNEQIDDVEAAFKEVVARYEMPFKLTFNAVRGFHLTLSERGFSLGDLPPGFIKITKAKGRYHFTSHRFIQLNELINCALEAVYADIMVITNSLLAAIEPHIECLFKVAEILSELDVTCSLAVAALCNVGYVRPKFSERASVVEASRHPIRAHGWTAANDGGFRCNPIYFTDEDRLIVLSGPNNSGKSVYMKQVALLQILAQVGSYVPAEWAVFRPAGTIVSRTGHGDDLHSNCSTFAVEVLRIGQMIHHVEEDSLIVIDELGRGTSEEDGAALCFAVANYLRTFKCFVIFSTHYEFVMQLERFYPAVSNYHMDAALDRDNRLVYRYALEVGVTPLTVYGVSAARQHGLSAAICAAAADVADEILQRPRNRSSRALDENDPAVKLRRRAMLLRRAVLVLSEGGTKTIAITAGLRSEICEIQRSLAHIAAAPLPRPL